MGKKVIVTDDMVNDIINSYQSNDIGLESLCKKHGLGKLKVKDILLSNGVKIKSKGAQITIGNSSEIESSKTNLYSSLDDKKKLVVVCKKTKLEFDDVNNLSGCLTRHILETYGNVPIPTNTYQRKKYELINGKKWYEEYFDIKAIEIDKIIKCSICGWETKDIGNKGGSLTKHITNEHNMTISNYIDLYPSENKYWTRFINYSDKIHDNNFNVKCLECGEYFLGLTETHMINSHNMSIFDYKIKYGSDVQIFSKNTSEYFSELTKEFNINKENTYISKGQDSVKVFIEDELGFKCSVNNKKLLEGIELDIVVDDKNVAIEYNGLFYHSENMGKHSSYHLDKTIISENKNIKLIHIFEDEWINKKDIVKARLRNILGVSKNKIYARKCVIKEIDSKVKSNFLNENHIQGDDKSSIRLGAYYDNELVGVMTFSKLRKSLGYSNTNSNEYELLRFASNSVIGLVGKFLKHFIKNYNPNKIISYADRRWSPIALNTVYSKVGFKFVKATKPNYWYTKNYKVREHRFNYRKDILVSKGYDSNKTEFEIMSELGYDKIWDCGSFKFEMII